MAGPEISIPVTWEALKTRDGARPAPAVQIFTYIHREFTRHVPGSPFFGPPFFEGVDALALGVVFGHGAVMEKGFAEVRGRAEEADAADGIEQFTSHNLAILGALALTEAGGWPRLAIDPAHALARLAELDGEDDAIRRIAWAHLAYGEGKDVGSRFLPRDVAAPPDPDAIVAVSAYRIQLHLAQVIAGGGGLAAAEPAWNAWLAAFPRTLAAAQTNFIELIWSARTVFHRIGGHPIDHFPAWLRDEVQRQAAMTSAILPRDLSFADLKARLTGGGWRETALPGRRRRPDPPGAGNRPVREGRGAAALQLQSGDRLPAAVRAGAGDAAGARARGGGGAAPRSGGRGPADRGACGRRDGPSGSGPGGR